MAVQAPELWIGATDLRPHSDALRRLFSGKWRGVVIPAFVFLVVVLLCFVVPPLFHVGSPTQGSLLQANLPPFTRGHLLGTDTLGDDVLSRCLYGGRTSIEVGLGSVFLGLIIGGGLGIVAGFFGGAADAGLMRLLDMFLAFPSLVLSMTVATYLGQSERNVIFAIAFFTVPAFARLSRAATLRVREMDYVKAAKIGARSTAMIVTRHIVPNVAPQLLTFACLSVANAIIIEAALSFLGLGVPPPQPTWGGMIAAGQTVLASEVWLVVAPGLFLLVTVMSLNMLSDALRVVWAEG